MSSIEENARPSDGSEIDDLVALYLDRLNAGKSVSPDEVLAEHPELGPDILASLEEFLDLGEKGGVEPRTHLGDYELRRRIGRGGMGVVYEAWQSSMSRAVAVKVLPAAIAADPKSVSRFAREARAAGSVHHPNVVSVYQMGIDGDTPFYAMELVDGETLSQALERLGQTRHANVGSRTLFDAEDLSPAYCFRLAEAFAGAAEGLEQAHRLGVVHRDLKPSNLILDREGSLRILDFGLARIEGQESLTMSGDLLGTLHYMSPEQARARQSVVDRRTDIYSLGATLFQMVTIDPPFRGKDAQDTLSQIIEREPPPPRSKNPRVPPDLETIILKCLRKEPADRYGTAEALAQDLRRFARGDAIEARPQPRWEIFRRRAWRQRRRLAATFVFIALALSLIALAINRSIEHRERARVLYESKVLQACLQLEVASLSQRGEGREGALLWPGASREHGFRPDPAPVDRIIKSLSEAAAILPQRPDALYHQSRALLCLGKEEECRKKLAELLCEHPGFTPALLLEATIVGGREGPQKALELEEAARMRAKTEWERSLITARQAWRDGRFPEAIEALGRIVEAGGSEPYVGANVLARMARGRARIEEKDLLGAIDDFAVVKAFAPKAVEPALLQGKVWHLLGRAQEAEQLFERIYEQAVVRDEVAVAVASIYGSLGEAKTRLAWAERLSVPAARLRLMASTEFWNLLRFHAAEEHAREAVDLEPENPSGHETLGYVLRGLGKYEEAEAILSYFPHQQGGLFASFDIRKSSNRLEF